MIQRIQTIYLFLAFVMMGVLPIFIATGLNQEMQPVFLFDHFWETLLFITSAVLSLISIFSFKKRQNQFVLGRLNIIFNVILFGLLFYRSLNLSGENLSFSEKGIGIFLPIISIVLLVLANKAIKKDEDLVKSVDRLR
jgi:hypothetical protein